MQKTHLNFDHSETSYLRSVRRKTPFCSITQNPCVLAPLAQDSQWREGKQSLVSVKCSRWQQRFSREGWWSVLPQWAALPHLPLPVGRGRGRRPPGLDYQGRWGIGDGKWREEKEGSVSIKRTPVAECVAAFISIFSEAIFSVHFHHIDYFGLPVPGWISSLKKSSKSGKNAETNKQRRHMPSTE